MSSDEKIEQIKLSLKFHQITIQGSTRISRLTNLLASTKVTLHYLRKMVSLIKEINKIVEDDRSKI